MKKIIILASLIGGTLLLAGCQKEFGRGGEVRFVASSVAGPGTRAEYSGEARLSDALTLRFSGVDNTFYISGEKDKPVFRIKYRYE